VADTIGPLLATACRRFRARPALVRGSEIRTYGELLERGGRLASALREAGLEPGTPVAAMLEDRIESLEVYLAAFLGGYPVIHVNDRLAAPEVAHILADSGARALFHTDGRSEAVDAAGARDATRLLVTIGADRPTGARGLEEMVNAARSAIWEAAPRSAGDLAIVGYTSGTTGLPKGAMISQRALTACVRLMPSMFRISPYGRCAFTGTLSFVSGIWGVILPHLYTGGTVTFLHPYTPESWVAHVEAERSTFTYAPTPLIPAFAAELRRRPGALAALESVIHSGSPVPRAHAEDLVDVIGERYIEVWGMTEGVAPFSATTRGDWRGEGDAEDVYASAGRAFPTATIQAVSPGGQVLPPGQEGELTVRADTGFDGYLGDQSLTSASFGPHGFRTGDLGRLDPAGYVYVTGRVKDLIISGGMNVYPAEVEAALATLPGVAECAVLGLPDERWGEAVTAVIVPAPGAELTEDQVIAYVRTRIAGYKRPQRVHFAAALPRNASMKVRKDQLREQLTGQPAGEGGPSA
jgi:acyl-CoA synthetase (AMP-forming)/AMP-acid ligase II